MKILYFLAICLKYLLIIFGILILLFLAAIFFILFVPIKYKIYFKKIENIDFKVEVKWLYPVLCIYVVNDIEKGVDLSIRILGRNINTFKPSSESKTLANNNRDIKISSNYKNIDIDSVPNSTIKDLSKSISKDKKNDNKKKEKKNSFLKNIFRFKHKKELTTDTIVFVINILRRILPKDAYIRVEFGREDPADTGSILAGISTLYPLYYKFLQVQGNFEKQCFYIELDLKGKVVIAKLIYEVIRYILKDSIRQLIDFIKQLRKENINGRKTTN